MVQIVEVKFLVKREWIICKLVTHTATLLTEERI